MSNDGSHGDEGALADGASVKDDGLGAYGSVVFYDDLAGDAGTGVGADVIAQLYVMGNSTAHIYQCALAQISVDSNYTTGCNEDSFLD